MQNNLYVAYKTVCLEIISAMRQTPPQNKTKKTKQHNTAKSVSHFYFLIPILNLFGYSSKKLLHSVN